MPIRKVPCRYCKGSGRDPQKAELCEVCDGDGEVELDGRDSSNCRVCGGTGRNPFGSGPCTKCGGKGFLYVETPPDRILFFNGKTPYSDRRKLSEVLSQITGVVRVCEGYLGTGSLTLFEHIPKAVQVQVLVGQRSSIPSELTHFKTEYPNFEFRKDTQKGIHDRYVLDDGGILILGHGFKDAGTKDSFALRLDKSVIGDMLTEVMSSFDSKWSNATPI
jgi:RecJ-like exonuclease